MFNFFGKKPEYNGTDGNGYQPVAYPDTNNEGYTIGSSNGFTVIKVTCGYNTITMTLAPNEVHRMIRLLKASMNQDPEEST